MKNKKLWLGMLVVVLVFGMTVTSCILTTVALLSQPSVPEPNDENKTLVVGTVIQQGRGYNISGFNVSVNGTNTVGIDITLQGLAGGQLYTMRTLTGGIFYSAKIPKGAYKITQLYLKKDSGSSWMSITWSTPDNEEHRVEIADGKVNNLGVIRWECENNVKNSISYNQEYGQVKDAFQEKNKSSGWNEKDWTNINIKSSK